MDNWYVIHVLTGKELDVKDVLQKEGFKSLVPRRNLRERKNGKWREVERLLFPGYVFVSVEMTENNYYFISGIPGVIDILRGASSSPEPVPFDEMQVIFRLTRNGDMVGISDVLFDGDSVKVLSGPLQGYEGLIVKVDKRRFRAKVKFLLAGLEKFVELGINAISKIV